MLIVALGLWIHKHSEINLNTPTAGARNSTVSELRYKMSYVHPNWRNPGLWIVTTHLLKSLNNCEIWRNECVKWLKEKMSRLNIRNEPVRLKNIRLGTQALNYAVLAQFLWSSPSFTKAPLHVFHTVWETWTCKSKCNISFCSVYTFITAISNVVYISTTLRHQPFQLKVLQKSGYSLLTMPWMHLMADFNFLPSLHIYLRN